jgi:putative ABC transport system ATP-binding protein
MFVSLHDIIMTYRTGAQKVSVLQGLNLEVEQGEFVSLMGPSGSGKTTLLNLIGGLDRPTAGTVTVGGARIEQLSASRLAEWRSRNVGFIFQFYNLMPTLTAARNVELPLLLRSMSSASRKLRVAAALDIVGLSHRAQHRPGTMSGGEQQRVAIARAFVVDPKILICDEPTGDLDRHTAEEILGMLRLLNKEHGKTIIMVTHDERAAEYATRRLKMDKGLLVQGMLEKAA